MNNKNNIYTQLTTCRHKLTILLLEIKEIEKDNLSTITEKHDKIKIIQMEINKVAAEIDILKKEITLLNNRNIN